MKTKKVVKKLGQTGPVRLQKLLSMAGVASRRAAEKMIEEGLVRVDGEIVREMGVKVDPEKGSVTVKGKPLKVMDRKIYFLFYKPLGCLTTVRDDKERPTIFHFLKGIKEKVFPVGRLDFNTEGLLIITNDGELAQALSHPSYKLEKTYEAKVRGVPKEETLKKLEGGIVLDDGEKTSPLKASLLRTTGKNAWLQFRLWEGKNRQIRRMCERIGHPVIKLKRTGIGFLKCSGLQPGDYRHLEEKEISKLRSFLKFKEGGEKLKRKRKLSV